MSSKTKPNRLKTASNSLKTTIHRTERSHKHNNIHPSMQGKSDDLCQQGESPELSSSHCLGDYIFMFHFTHQMGFFPPSLTTPFFNINHPGEGIPL